MKKQKWTLEACLEVERRWEAGETLKAIGESYGLSVERMRQIIRQGRRLARHAYFLSLPPVIDADTKKLRPPKPFEAPEYLGPHPFSPLKRRKVS